MFRSKNLTFISAVLTLIFVFALTSAVVAGKPDNRGRGNGNGKRSAKVFKGRNDREEKRIRKIEKKDDKFINRHDARDGRLDGRGPK